MRKKSDEKNPKFWTLLKRPKMAFLGEQNFTIKNTPPLYSPRSEYRGGILNRNCPDVKHWPQRFEILLEKDGVVQDRKILKGKVIPG